MSVPPASAPTAAIAGAWVAFLTFVAVALSALAITPKLLPWRDNPLVFETTKVASLIEQLEDPAGWDKKHLNDPEFNGIQTIRLRILPPVLGRALGLSPGAYLTLPWIALVALVWLVVHYALRAGLTRVEALAVGVLTGTSSAFFSASCAVGYFDPFYLIPLLFVCYARSPVLVLGACLLGPWVDEKFLFMLPACGLVRWSWQPQRRWVWQAALALAPYCLARLAALGMGDSSFSRQIEMQAAMFPHYAPALPQGWWFGFRAGWVAVAIGGYAVWRELDRRERGLFAASLVGAVAALSFLAWDTTRTIAMLLPLLLAGLSQPGLRRALPWLAGANLFLPAAYVWCGIPVTVPLTSILFR